MNRCVRPHEIDLKKMPVVVFESDDWGACEYVPSPEAVPRYRAILSPYGISDGSETGTLESGFELNELFHVLMNHRGGDGKPPVFTAYTCMGNPDYAAIRENGFAAYADIPLGEGFPEGWERPGLLEKYQEGIELGVWHPEYHALLHHTNPEAWISLLRKGDSLARALFDLGCYYQFRHIPEYEGYSVRGQHAMISEGFRRFEKLFGRAPSCAVTSDAYPETELLWAVLGISTVALKNCRINSGEVVVYPTKPWNNQDVYARIGDCDPMLDVCFLTRNVFMESGVTAQTAEKTIEKVWAMNEPAVISTHRGNYSSLHPGAREHALKRLDDVLTWCDARGAVYMDSASLGNLYRKGQR